MLFVFIISVAITVFLLLATLLTLVTGEDPTEVRLAEVSAAAPQTAGTSLISTTPTTGLGRAAAQVTRLFNPVRGIITGTDADLEYKLMLAGFRKPEHMEIFTATKLLLPVIGIVVGTFFPSNLVVALMVGGVAGFFGPDMVLSYLVTRRQEKIRLALPDALDLLVVCMEAGLGIDQAMVRVGDEMTLTAPDLAEEFQIVNREQRAGKPRLDAWRSLADRVDNDFVRQFVTMLVQTERFGTPIAHAMGVFADTLRIRRTQAAEEAAAKTGVKLLFPLVLFIFPSIFVVALGPAILGLQKMFEDLSK
ncbi:MAG TPA: type II secretion system F family protein [Candidatus Angelobacter sp.]|nr:type II secretion system F family protein [Candidatus Angelobacter sp.]